MLKLLLEYGADLSIKDEKGYDSRLYTISEKKIDLMNYLFDISFARNGKTFKTPENTKNTKNLFNQTY